MSQMYSIDPRHLNIKKADGGMTRYNPSSIKYRPLNEFDLANASVYSENGELIKEADQIDYDWQIAIKLQRISPLYKIEDLLNHHFEKTADKELFLKHIRYHIAGFLPNLHPARKEFILEWVDETKKRLKHSKKHIEVNIPELEIERFRKQLIQGLVLTEDGENTNQIGIEKFKSKPLIALLIKELSHQYKLPETEVFRQVKSIWKLESPELKNYKKPTQNKIGDYEGYLDSITSQQ